MCSCIWSLGLLLHPLIKDISSRIFMFNEQKKCFASSETFLLEKSVCLELHGQSHNIKYNKVNLSKE